MAALIEYYIILLDGPFNFLDKTTKKKLAQFIIDYHKINNTLILLSSNIDLNEFFEPNILNFINI